MRRPLPCSRGTMSVLRTTHGRVLRAVGAAGITLVAAGAINARSAPVRASSLASGPLSGSPIQHVVVIYQENHSFNDLLGRLGVQERNRCTGTDVGTIS